MLQFNVGAIEEAYAELCRVVLECDERGDAVCDPKREALFYRDVGVVLAAGKKQHDAGVQAFKKAISLDPLVSIPQEYRSEKVNRAFAEALYGPQRQIAPSFDLEPTRPSVHEVNPSSAPQGPRKNGFFMVEAVGKLGIMGEVRSDCDVVDCNDSAAGVSTLGIAGTVGGTPTNGPFALAGRARVGAYYWRESGSPAGYFGTAALAGAIFGKRTEPRFAYVLAGPGFESHPASGEFLFTAHALGGVSLNGFDIGGGFDVAAGELSDPFPSPGFDRTYSYMVLFGVHVGYAGLF